MDYKKFYDGIRGSFTLTSQNVRGFDSVIKAALNKGVSLFYLSYILATAFHETAHTMQPIAEYGKGKGRKYGVKGKYGQVPYGRGYVQLTWDYNYEKADKELGLKGALLKNFDLALNPKIAAEIMFKGMEQGWFTGLSLKDFIDNVDEGDKEDLREFSNARKIINGTDKQVMIGQYAIVFEKALKAAGYPLKGTGKRHESDLNASGEPVQSNPDVPAVQVPKTPKTSLWDILVTFLLYIFKGGK